MKSTELLSDYKTAVNLVRVHSKIVAVLVFVGSIAAGSKDGFDGAKPILGWFFGHPESPRNFAQWFPVAIGLYCGYCLYLWWQRLAFRRAVITELTEGVDRNLLYRWNDDLNGRLNPTLGTIVRRMGQVFLLMAPLLSFVFMWIGLNRWCGSALAELLGWGDHIWVGAFVYAGLIGAAITVIGFDVRTGRTAAGEKSELE